MAQQGTTDGLVASAVAVIHAHSLATRTALLLCRDGDLYVGADQFVPGAGTVPVEYDCDKPLDTASPFPMSVIKSLQLSNKPVVLASAATGSEFSADRYCRVHAIKSIFALPISFRGQLFGVLCTCGYVGVLAECAVVWTHTCSPSATHTFRPGER